MYKLTIGIPSYQRPAMLEKLVRSIFSCNIDHYLIAHLDIVVMDNDVDRSAEPVIKSLIASNTNEFYHLHYFNYPEKGLSNVRNEIIDTGDVVCFQKHGPLDDFISNIRQSFFRIIKIV